VELSTHIDRVKDTAVVRLNGRLDAVSSAALEEKLLELSKKGEKKLLLDFTKVSYLSSAGMRLLLSMTKKASAEGGIFSLFGVHEDVMEIIKMAGFEKVLSIYPDQTAALGL